MSQNIEPKSSTWRAFFWRVPEYETKKLLPMLALLFCIAFSQPLLRDAKDVAVMMQSDAAEVRPFLREWSVTCAAILFVFVYSKLANRLSREVLFYVVMIPFLLFFVLFAFLFYPNRDLIRLDSCADYLKTLLPVGLSELVESTRHWYVTILYILAELWGSAIVAPLFWGFANDLTKVTDVRRLYPFFWIGGLGTSLGAATSGSLAEMASRCLQRVDVPQRSLTYSMVAVIVSGVLALSIYYWTNRSMRTDSCFVPSRGSTDEKAPRIRMSLGDSLIFLAKSPYLLSLAALILAYGLSNHFFEAIWKDQLRIRCPMPCEYVACLGKYSTMMGKMGCVLMVFVGVFGMGGKRHVMVLPVVMLCGIFWAWAFSAWETIAFVAAFFCVGMTVKRRGCTALLTPFALFITGMSFFGCLIFQDELTPYFALARLDAFTLLGIVAMGHVIMSRVGKFLFFDAMNEMAYIPLDRESKIKGKALLELVGVRVGPSVGVSIQHGLVAICGSLAAALPYVAGLFLIVIAIWVLAVRFMSRQFTQLTQAQEAATTG